MTITIAHEVRDAHLVYWDAEPNTSSLSLTAQNPGSLLGLGALEKSSQDEWVFTGGLTRHLLPLYRKCHSAGRGLPPAHPRDPESHVPPERNQSRKKSTVSHQRKIFTSTLKI